MNNMGKIHLHVMLEREEYDGLEEVRRRLGYRTISRTIRYLIEKELKKDV
jgi:hypothetical protein